MRLALPLLAMVLLAACSGKNEAVPTVTVEGLATQVVMADAVDGRAWDGVVEAVRQAVLSAQTSGRVQEVLHDVNDRVTAGAVLVHLSTVEQRAGLDAARAQQRAAEAAVAEAEATFRRYQELAADQYVSKLQLDQVRTARDAAVAAHEAATAQVASIGQQSAYTIIRAPYAGIVSSRDVEPGESIGVGQPLVGIFAPEALRIEVSLPQADAEHVRASPSASIVLPDGRRVPAREVTVFPAADVATHAVRVRVQLPSLDPAPAPGTTVKVAFPATAGASRVRVPSSALVRRGELTAIYVVDDGRLSLRQLRLGREAGGQVEVISGLKAGESIAIDPVAALQALAAARGKH